jgi:hypothetical protein
VAILRIENPHHAIERQNANDNHLQIFTLRNHISIASGFCRRFVGNFATTNP